jgi:hypothetical protein
MSWVSAQTQSHVSGKWSFLAQGVSRLSSCRPLPAVGLGLDLTGVRCGLALSKHGVILNAPTGAAPSWLLLAGPKGQRVRSQGAWAKYSGQASE